MRFSQRNIFDSPNPDDNAPASMPDDKPMENGDMVTKPCESSNSKSICETTTTATTSECVEDVPKKKETYIIIDSEDEMSPKKRPPPSDYDTFDSNSNSRSSKHARNDDSSDSTPAIGQILL